MNRYIAFLRGINISGKNKIVMSELKEKFEQINFTDVSTYLNSGNVIFSSENDDIAELKHSIEEKNLDCQFLCILLIGNTSKMFLQTLPNGGGQKTKISMII